MCTGMIVLIGAVVIIALALVGRGCYIWNQGRAAR